MGGVGGVSKHMRERVWGGGTSGILRFGLQAARVRAKVGCLVLRGPNVGWVLDRSYPIAPNIVTVGRQWRKKSEEDRGQVNTSALFV